MDECSAKLHDKFLRAFIRHCVYIPRMLIWTLAIGLLAIIGAIGYYSGAVRLAVSLLGLFIGLMLAMPLAPMVQPLMGRIGVTHPMWTVVWPPIIVLLLVYFVFIGVSFFVHRKIALYFKYRSDDIARIRWERINGRLGTCLGLGMGAVWLVVLSLMIYIAGYVTVQVASADEGNPTWMRYLNQARHDLKASGLERTVAKFDLMPARYYEGADIIGLIYNNPIVLSRLAQYPAFLSLGEKPEFQAIATDPEFSTLLLSKGDIVQMVQHPSSQTIINNPEILGNLLNQDLGDLKEYLNTGVSPKFADERILGRWYLDNYATLTAERKKRPDITSSEMRRLKKEIMDSLKSVELMATPENQVILKVPSSGEPEQAEVSQNPNQFQGGGRFSQQPGMDRGMADRYGLQGSQSRGGQRPQARQQAPAQPKKPESLLSSATGSWRRNGSTYNLQLTFEKGGSQRVKAVATEDAMTIETPRVTLIFTKSF